MEGFHVISILRPEPLDS